jgi:hypothetical protein
MGPQLVARPVEQEVGVDVLLDVEAARALFAEVHDADLHTALPVRRLGRLVASNHSLVVRKQALDLLLRPALQRIGRR